MFCINRKSGNLESLEKEVEALLEDMVIEGRDSDTYSKMAESLEKICKAKSYEKTASPIDWNEVTLNILGCIIPVLMILNFEKLDIMKSKAFQLIRKIR